MQMKFRMARPMVAVVALFFVAAFASPSAAQVAAGRIDATVTDSTGAVLPGVTVDVTGPQNATEVTDSLGQAHFLNLAPGAYTVTAKLSGFGDYLNKSVPVATGVSVPLRISLSVAGVSSQVEVTSEAPVVDTKKMTTSTDVDLAQLQNIPTARDPWVVMQTVPGIVLDRVNVGGGESGQQPGYKARGANEADNTWSIDGVSLTDMAATGSSSTYYDFDMFQDMQVTTGGADAQNGTPGVQLNMVFKSGSNTPHGSARMYFDNEGLESNNMPADLAATLGGSTGKGNRIHQYKDYGGEMGGPIFKNKLWAWAAEGKTHIDLITLAGGHDKTDLHDTSVKITGQSSPAIRENFSWFRGNKVKLGRNASVTHPPETTFDQTGPTDFWKGETNFVLGNSLFLATRYAHVKGGFRFDPEGGLQAQEWIDDAGTYHGSVGQYITNRPQDQVSADGSYFKGHHELKYGFSWKRAPVTSSYVYPGNGVVTIGYGYPLLEAKITRPGGSAATGMYSDLYAGDTISMNRLTMQLSVRYDRNASSLDKLSVTGSSVLPDLLPPATGGAQKNAIVWQLVTPRVGATYALDSDRKTVARASYAMFMSQLGNGAATRISTVQYSAIYYYAVDQNGNHIADPNEIDFSNPISWYGFDPSNPNSQSTINQIGKYTTPRTHEVVVGLDREVMPNLGVSADVTWRRYTNFDWTPLIGVTRADYTQTGTLTGNVPPIGQFNTPFYALNPAAEPPGNGTTYVAQNGYHERYLGFEMSATKRMSNRWMARLGFSTNSDKQYYDDPNTSINDPTSTLSNPNINGGDIITSSGGSGKSGIYLVAPKYQITANGLYQGPWGLNFGANYLMRQGYAEPFYRSRVNTGDPVGSKSVLAVSDVTAFRLPAVNEVDARVEKNVKVNRFNFDVDFDVFNLLNSATVLGRAYDLRLTNFNKVQEIMDPRVARIGVRFNF
jgi:hypothetical protein